MSEFQMKIRRGKSCAVQACKNTPSKNHTLSWHLLPKSKWLREKWIELLGIKGETNGVKVCSSHFKASDFVIYDSKILRHNAVPSVNLAIDSSETSSEEYDDIVNLTSSEDESFSIRIRKKKNEDFSKKLKEAVTPIRPLSRKSALVALDKISKTLQKCDHDESSASNSSSEEHEYKAEEISTLNSICNKSVVILNRCDLSENCVFDCINEMVKEQKTKKITDTLFTDSVSPNKEDPVLSLKSENTIDLAMECYEELLTDSQMKAYRKAKDEYYFATTKISALKMLHNAKVTYCTDPSILPPIDSVTTVPINTSIDNLIIPDTSYMKTVTSNNTKCTTGLLTVTETSLIIPSNKSITQLSDSVSKLNIISTTATSSFSAGNGLTNRPIIITPTIASTTVGNSTMPVLSYTNNLPGVNQQSLAILQHVSPTKMVQALPQQSTIFLANNQVQTSLPRSNTTNTLQFVPGNMLQSNSCKFVVNSKTGAVLGTMTVDPVTCNSVCKIPEAAFSGASIQIVKVASLPTTVPMMPVPAFPVKLLSSSQQNLLKTENDTPIQDDTPSDIPIQNDTPNNTPVQNDVPKDNSKENEIAKANSNEILSAQGVTTIYGGIEEITPHFILTTRPSLLRPLNETTIKHENEKLMNELTETEFIKRPLHWLMKKNIIPSQPLCRKCTMGFLHLIHDEYNQERYIWKCRNERCGRESSVARLLFFDRFDNIPLSKAFALTYHWAVQSEVNTVLDDTNVNIQQLKLVWRAIQDVCARSVALKSKKLGGKNSIVEIGIARIGRLFVLGALDRNTRATRLKALPSGIGWSLAVFYIEPWLHVGTTVLSNNSNLDCLNQRGFHHVLATSPKDKYPVRSPNNINRISKYLVTHLSDTFGGYNVDQLRLVDLQAFLDELQWRERFGDSPISAFWNIFEDIIEQSGHKFKFVPEDSETLMSKRCTEKKDEKILLIEPPKVLSCNKIDDSAENIIEVQSKRLKNITDVFNDSELDEVLNNVKKAYNNSSSPSIIKSTHVMKTRNGGNKIPLTTWDSTEKGISEEKTVEVSKKTEKTLEFIKQETNLKQQRKKIRPESMVALEEQYYAKKNPSKKLLKNECKGNYQFKCLICKKIIENNIKVMKHINAHIDNQRQCKPALSDLTQCKYCFRDFDTPYNVQCHIESVHLKMNFLVCRICNLDFEISKKLEAHMQQFHSLSEMPYECKVCRYRSSFHEDVMHHFEEVHTGTDKVLCHYCLRVFHIKFSNIGLGFIQNYFYHLHKHQSKASTKKCSSCCLIFLSSSELKEHRAQDHKTMKGLKGVHQIKSTFMAPVEEKSVDKVTTKSYPAAVLSTKSTTDCVPLSPKKKDKKLKDMSNIIISPTAQRCCECDRPMNPRHFGRFLTCGSCAYSTNCCKAFVDHMIIKHSRLKRTVKCLGMETKPVILKTPMVCDCGYSSTDGNALATHLVLCKKITCHVKKSMKTVIKQEPDGSWHIENTMDISQTKNCSKSDSGNETRLSKLKDTYDQSSNSAVDDIILLDNQMDSAMDISFVGNDTSDQGQKPVAQNETSYSEAQEKVIDKSRDMLNALGLVRKPLSLLEAKEISEDAKESTEDIKDELLYCEVEESATKTNTWEEIEIVDDSNEPIILS